MDYNTKRWERARSARLRIDGYMCQECKRYGNTVEATTVHHILPARDCVGRHSRLLYDSRNLISLCWSCHERMHIRHSGKLSKTGEALRRRRRVLEL